MRIFRALDNLSMAYYDNNGEMVEGREFVVKEGSRWRLREDGISYIGGEITLEGEMSHEWVEVAPETLEAYFIEV